MAARLAALLVVAAVAVGCGSDELPDTPTTTTTVRRSASDVRSAPREANARATGTTRPETVTPPPPADAPNAERGGPAPGAPGETPACKVTSTACKDCLEAHCADVATPCNEDPDCHADVERLGRCLCSAERMRDARGKHRCETDFTRKGAVQRIVTLCIQRHCGADCL